MTKLRKVAGFLAGASLALSACAMFDKYAGSSGEIRFTHAVHQKAEVECITCHETVYDAEDLSERHLPAEKVCLACHKKEKESGNCEFCHADKDKPRTWRERKSELVFNHVAHLERVEDENCGVCHTRTHEPGHRQYNSPPMATCLGCHEHQQAYDEGKCNQCHTDLWRYPLVPVSDFTHKGDFLRRHAAEARATGSTCQNCHEQQFCAECHAAATSPMPVEYLMPERVDRSFIHRIDYLPRHTSDAVADPAMCMRCHSRSYCEECHTRNNLTAEGTDPRNPHPAGWVLPGPNNHGFEARRNIASCAACHDQGAQSNCVSCHKVGGVGGNPHPPGYEAQHKIEEARTNNMCRTCHG